MDLLRVVLLAFFQAFGSSLNDFLGRKRAEQTQRDLGRTEAERDEAIAGRDAAEAMTKAAVNAPSSIGDAIKRLEEGSA